MCAVHVGSKDDAALRAWDKNCCFRPPCETDLVCVRLIHVFCLLSHIQKYKASTKGQKPAVNANVISMSIRSVAFTPVENE